LHAQDIVELEPLMQNSLRKWLKALTVTGALAHDRTERQVGSRDFNLDGS